LVVTDEFLTVMRRGV